MDIPKIILGLAFCCSKTGFLGDVYFIIFQQ